MNYKDKADQLVHAFRDLVAIDHKYDDEPIFGLQQECAKIVVGEIMDALLVTTGHCDLRDADYNEVQQDLRYWNDVLEEIPTINEMALLERAAKL